MKLNRNLVQITGAALASSLVSIICMTTFQPGGTTSTPTVSERISWGDAQALMDEYTEFRPMQVEYLNTTTQKEEVADLKGFLLDANHIREILDNNHSAQGNPDELLITFGQQGTFSAGGRKNANMRIIAIGVKNKELLTDDTTGTGPSIYDKADPCPPNCPR